MKYIKRVQVNEGRKIKPHCSSKSKSKSASKSKGKKGSLQETPARE